MKDDEEWYQRLAGDMERLNETIALMRKQGFVFDFYTVSSFLTGGPLTLLAGRPYSTTKIATPAAR